MAYYFLYQKCHREFYVSVFKVRLTQHANSCIHFWQIHHNPKGFRAMVFSQYVDINERTSFRTTLEVELKELCAQFCGDSKHALKKKKLYMIPEKR